MRTLAIDTSGRACSIALFEGETVIAARHELLGRGHAEALIPWIAELPNAGKADALLVGCGPGSFTGVRVGIAAARALGLGWGVPVAGMSSLALMAAAIAGEGVALIAIEGGHGELFCQRIDLATLAASEPVASLTTDTASTRFSEGRVLGSGAARLVEARGYGQALDGDADAKFALRLPLALRNLVPSPVYGRGPDAKPMA